MDKLAHIVKSKEQEINLQQVVEWVTKMHYDGKNKDYIIGRLFDMYPGILPKKIEALYNIGMQ